MTRERINAKGEGMIFADAKEVQEHTTTGQVHLQAKIKVQVVEKLENENGDLEEASEIFDTTVGRVLLYSIVPAGLPFSMVNKKMAKKTISQILNACYRNIGLKKKRNFCRPIDVHAMHTRQDQVLRLVLMTLMIPEEKAKIIGQANSEVEEIEAQFASGLVTQGEKYNKVIDIWSCK